MKQYYLKLFIPICVFIFSNTLLHAYFTNKTDIIIDLASSFLQTRDFNTLKMALQPLMKSDIDHIVIHQNSVVIFELGPNVAYPFYFNKYSREKDVGSNNFFTTTLQFKNKNLIILEIVILLISGLLFSLLNAWEQKRKLTLQLVHLSQKVAHDIRTPLSTLRIISSKIENFEIKELQLSVIEQIDNIASEILDSHRLHHNQEREVIQTNTKFRLFDLIKNLEKEYEFKKVYIKRKILFHVENDATDICFKNERISSLIYRTLNNCIQNSIDATTDTGEIIVSAKFESRKQVVIEISDNGSGIPDYILQKLGEDKISYGKEDKQKAQQGTVSSGSGVAIYNAKRDLAVENIKFSIASKIGSGTIVRLNISKSAIN